MTQHTEAFIGFCLILVFIGVVIGGTVVWFGMRYSETELAAPMQGALEGPTERFGSNGKTFARIDYVSENRSVGILTLNGNRCASVVCTSSDPKHQNDTCYLCDSTRYVR